MIWSIYPIPVVVMSTPPRDILLIEEDWKVKAMVLDGTGRAEERLLTLRDMPIPRAGRGEVVIDVEACGVCRTDLHLLEGEVSRS